MITEDGAEGASGHDREVPGLVQEPEDMAAEALEQRIQHEASRRRTGTVPD
jgi:hypothetical protein